MTKIRGKIEMFLLPLRGKSGSGMNVWTATKRLNGNPIKTPVKRERDLYLTDKTTMPFSILISKP
jgi:hypothetical protein